jgi:hypothetical protein
MLITSQTTTPTPPSTPAYDWTQPKTPFTGQTPGSIAVNNDGTITHPLVGDTPGSAASANTQINSLVSKSLVFNPPVHNLTKAPKAEWVASSYFSDSSGQGGYNGSQFDPLKMNWGRLGAVYTWDYNNNINVSAEEQATPEYQEAQNQFNSWQHRWGVMFHYNPTSLSYAVQSNENIPAFNTAGDAMNLIVPGAATVGIDLYFNRIYDLAYGGNLTGLNAKNSYNTWLSDEDINGIKTRGTEYDIEFIYRACNGDPGDVMHVDYKTADYGFFMRTPIVLHLGPFRYLGFLTGVSVNHILFNTSMVPTFSQVHLDFARMITMGRVNTTSGENPMSSAIAASNTVGTTSTTETPTP